MARQYGHTRPLHDFAEVDEWGDALPEWQRQEKAAAAQRARNQLGNEVRWGDIGRFTLDIPATSTAPVETRVDQILDVRAPARSWTGCFSLTWSNIAAGDPGDTLQADFISEIGVGSARAVFFTGLAIPQVSPVNVNSTILPAFPASTIIVSARIRVTPVSGSARTYSATLSALMAPVTR